MSKKGGNAVLRNIHLMAREFFRNPFFVTLLGCTLVYLCSAGWPSFTSYSGLLDAAPMSLFSITCYLGLAVFMILGYEYTNRVRSASLYETIDSHRGGAASNLWAQLGLLFSMAILYWLVVCGLCMFRLWSVQLLGCPLTGNILLATVLYGLFPALAGTLLGAAGQTLGGRVSFYTFMAFSVFFSSDMGNVAYSAVQYQTETLLNTGAAVAVQRVLDLWHCLMPTHAGMFETDYGVGIEPFHWALVLMWCLLPLAILLWSLRGWGWKSLSAISLTLGLICAGAALWQGNNWGRSIEGYSIDRSLEYNYYERLSHRLDSYVEPEDAYFHVTAYDMDLRFFFQLRADVRLTLDGTYQDEYHFTLYHDFRISQVTDSEGKKLDYTQERDYVTIYNPNTAALTELRIVYAGWRYDDYAMTAQGIYLPGYFCYYPVEGHRAVVDDRVVYAYNTPLPTRSFRVRISAMCPVFTNLSGGKDGIFTGEAQDVSILGGQFTEVEQGGVRYILPWTIEPMSWLDHIAEGVELLNKNWGLDIPAPYYTAVVVSDWFGSHPNSVLRAYGNTLYIYSWTSPASSDLLYAHIQNCLSTASDNSYVKQWCLAIIRSFYNGDNTGLTPLQKEFGSTAPTRYVTPQGVSNEEDAYRRTGYEIYRAIDQSSLQEIIQKMYTYLAAGGGDDEAFIHSLGER